MSKLFALSEWVTLEEAAEYLMRELGESVTTKDILRLAIDKRIALSIHFVNNAHINPGLRDSISGHVNFESSIKLISGVWDLPMIGEEATHVHQALQRKLGGPEVECVPFDDILVVSPDRERYGRLLVFRPDLATPPCRGSDNYQSAIALPDDAPLVS